MCCGLYNHYMMNFVTIAPLRNKTRPLLLAVFALYILAACWGMLHHELWGDELHTWNIARSSDSLSSLLYNRRYEGHPPLWHILLWCLSRFTHDLLWLQVLHLIIAIAVAGLLLFAAPFRSGIRILLPFGYYFLYEYALFSRNYALGVLLALLLCIVLQGRSRYKALVYYSLLFLLSNTHLLTLILAGSFQLFWLWRLREQGRSRAVLAGHLLLGLLILLPAVYFILPPPDTELSVAASLRRWSNDRLLIAAQAPLRAFVPLPAWWQYHFWNKECLLELNKITSLFKGLNLLLSLGLLPLLLGLLKGDRKCQAFFLFNLLLTCLAGLVFVLGTQRYTGFIFVGFIVALWLYAGERGNKSASWASGVFGLLLLVQAAAGLFATVKDVRLPFSNFYRVGALLQQVPAGEKVVTEYWSLIAAAAYRDKPFYCLDLQQEATFITWDGHMAAMTTKPRRYCEGLQTLAEKEGLKRVYFLSASTPDQLSQVDDRLFSDYRVTLLSRTQGAIEPWSDLYLYEITGL